MVRVALTLLALLLTTAPALAQSYADAPALGIALEGIAYPYPVHFLPLTVSGQPVRMAYMDVSPEGSANGQVIVLLHGKNFPSSYWGNTIRVLTRAGYRVVVPDQIGGFLDKSSKPDIAYTFDLLAANTARLLDVLGVRKAVVVGHSTGGMLAVRFARTYPERVTRLVLEDPLGLEDYRRTVPPQTTERLMQDEMRTTTAGYRAYVHHYFVTWKPEYEEFVALRMRLNASGEFPRWAQASALTTQMIYGQPVRSEYSLLRPPTLLIVGREDHTAPLSNDAPPPLRVTMGHIAELARAAVRDIPHATLVIVPECGHIPHLEQPIIFHQALFKFLGQSRRTHGTTDTGEDGPRSQHPGLRRRRDRV